MGKDQVMRVCEHYAKTKEFPNNEYKWGMVPVGADSGYYDENLIYPDQIKKDLEQIGFEVEIYAYLGRRNKVVRIINSFISFFTPISLFLAPSLRIIARKK